MAVDPVIFPAPLARDAYRIQSRFIPSRLRQAFVAMAVLGVPTTSPLIEPALDVDKSLRRILGFRATLALIERALGGRIIGAWILSGSSPPPAHPRRRAGADVHARTNSGRSRSRRVSSGRSRRTSSTPPRSMTRAGRSATPIVDRNFRADHQAKAEWSREVERLKLIHMPDFHDLIYDLRTMAKRVNVRLKDEFGADFSASAARSRPNATSCTASSRSPSIRSSRVADYSTAPP